MDYEGCGDLFQRDRSSAKLVRGFSTKSHGRPQILCEAMGQRKRALTSPTAGTACRGSEVGHHGITFPAIFYSSHRRHRGPASPRARDQLLVTLGLRPGFRIAELLSLNLADVMTADGILTGLTVSRPSAIPSVNLTTLLRQESQ